MRRIKVIVTGQVQGVWFRSYTQEKARELGITGWVRNVSDGTVTLVAEGNDKQLIKLTKWLEIGSPNANVDTLKVNWGDSKGKLNSFEVIK